MPANPKPTTLWYMLGICKGPSSLTWLYRLPKTWHVCGHVPWYKNQRIPTKPQNPGVHLA